MAKSDPTKAPAFKRTLKNLLSAPPKSHEEMKVGRRKSKGRKKPVAKRGKN